MAYILLIIMAWVITMPLWLSITVTIGSSVALILRFILNIIKFSDLD